MSETTSDSYTGSLTDTRAIVLSSTAALSFLITLPPLIICTKKYQLPTTTLLTSIAYLNLQNVINPIIWQNDNRPFRYHGYILCDVEAKIQVGLTITIPASAACICRSLWLVFSNKHQPNIQPSTALWRSFVTFDVVVCLILPICVMSAHILVQPYRYYIYGVVGCQYSLQWSWTSLIVVLIWPLLLSTTGTVYSILMIIQLIQHQRQINSILRSAQLNATRFARIFALAMLVIVYTAVGACNNIQAAMVGFNLPWRWTRVHPADWAARIIEKDSSDVNWLDRWIQVGTGWLAFAVFGLGSDAIATYRSWAQRSGVLNVWEKTRVIVATWKKNEETRSG